MPEISVIVPVYRAEAYLRRCLETIKCQTFQDFEVLLIDDGSSDSSGSICDEYAEKDSRFKVIHKENGGVASARSVGIQLAIGKYSIQFDPDDWIESNMLQLLYEKAEIDGASIVVCDFFKEYSHNSSEVVTHRKRPIDKDLLIDEFLTGRMQASFWNKLVLHRLYGKNGITLNPALTRWEDVYAICSLFRDVDVVSFVDVPLYHYDLYSNPNSLVRFCSLSGLKSQIFVTDHFWSLYGGTSHRCSVWQMKKATKGLAYDVLNSKDYISLYRELNNETVRNGLTGQSGIGGVFQALTIITGCSFFQGLYNMLQRIRYSYKFYAM